MIWGYLVRPEGLEPPAYWFEASRSIQLSYGHAVSTTRIQCTTRRARWPRSTAGGQEKKGGRFASAASSFQPRSQKE
jgi:hypothetical protein